MDGTEHLATAARTSVLRLGAELRALLGVETVDEAELVAALEAAGALVRAGQRPAPPQKAARPAAQLWALAKAASAQPPPDPWEAHRLWERPTELCIRHDYDARRRLWSASETLCKMEAGPFGRGAMRECFRLKKMSQFNPAFFYSMDWRHCANYVAKRYLEPGVGREIYLADVQMQAEAKLWAGRYNRLRPPKAVDFLNAFAIELPQRGGQLFGVERLIEGPYQKRAPARSRPHRRAPRAPRFEHRAPPSALSRPPFALRASPCPQVQRQLGLRGRGAARDAALFLALHILRLARPADGRGRAGALCAEIGALESA